MSSDVFGFMCIALIWKFDFSPFMVLIIAILNDVITKFCSERIAKYAFEYAYLNNRKKVTAMHKANITKLADGLFLEFCQEVAKKYPSITYNEIIVDNCCMQLVARPEQFFNSSK
ncbi:hypothetical protein EUTSA_v10027171mg [Eutrema salsugineum]|uniref:Isopropylmalate dehydrogenase-like domain-containing protein n=1 Tax=Eutrema salsugineum TaxID=72664 RepID=V4MGZ7_EUTSA|nr:hypothetical protein EUTSA_v10027171mg [Eutrema salsugineum]